jgi:hypothetical protein
MFKWAVLCVAVVALAAFGWMVNDMRLEVKKLAAKADLLVAKADDLLDKTDKQLPPIMAQTERVSAQLDHHLPLILDQTESATKTINTQLPVLLVHSEIAVDNISELSDGFKQYKGLFSFLHGDKKDAGLASYGGSILSFLGGAKALIGVKPGPDGKLKQAVPAKQWAAAAERDVNFLSLTSKSKSELLHGLAKTNTTAPLHIQVENQPPRLLSDFLKEQHPDSKNTE